MKKGEKQYAKKKGMKRTFPVLRTRNSFCCFYQIFYGSLDLSSDLSSSDPSIRSCSLSDPVYQSPASSSYPDRSWRSLRQVCPLNIGLFDSAILLLKSSDSCQFEVFGIVNSEFHSIESLSLSSIIHNSPILYTSRSTNTETDLI
jgi:hypothetical protein